MNKPQEGFSEQKAVYLIVNKTWQMFKADSRDIGTTDDWMQSMMDKYNNFCNEYIYGPMRGVALDMSKMCINELERLFKEKNHIGGPDDRWKGFEG